MQPGVEDVIDHVEVGLQAMQDAHDLEIDGPEKGEDSDVGIHVGTELPGSDARRDEALEGGHLLQMPTDHIHFGLPLGSRQRAGEHQADDIGLQRRTLDHAAER